MDEEEDINVEIVMNNKTDVIMTSVERILVTKLTWLDNPFHVVALILVIVGNCYVVKRILERSKTFLDWLVVTDSLLFLGEIGKFCTEIFYVIDQI